MVLLSFPRPVRFLELRVPEEAKNLAGKVLRLIQDPLATGSFPKILATCQNNSPRALNSRFKFDKRSQLFIRSHDEALSVAMRVHNPDRSAFNPKPTHSPNSIRLCC